MNKEYTLIIERGEDGLLIGSILELPGCHTQGKTIEELLFNIREAIELYLEVEKPDVTTEFVGLQKIIL
ncbi:MAG: type II toxin-antitoxin system HicB family antitoxin [Clostridiales bacterium]|nr:type II toxin-antitoxin system HicB family antitoxin [Clostridiales bacterium]